MMGIVEKPRNHKDLEVWKQSMDLVDGVYRTTKGFPAEEIYGLTSQMRRAAISIPSNIAEGAARSGKKEFVQFLRVSLGSLSELETQFLISARLGYVEQEEAVVKQIETVRKLLLGLIRHQERANG